MAVGRLKKLKNSYKNIIQAVTDAGGKFIFVGGCVRDALLDVPIKDYDAEVYNLKSEKLEEILKNIGSVSFAGQSFGVYHLHHRNLEISIPRTDQKVGTGHRGFKIFADPFLTFTEASQRRDLTMNSMGYDPITNELLDPWNGQKDIKDQVLRTTDSDAFGEDPLRALRVMQLSARFLMKSDKDLMMICSQQDLSELPSERILTEFSSVYVATSGDSRLCNADAVMVNECIYMVTLSLQLCVCSINIPLVQSCCYFPGSCVRNAHVKREHTQQNTPRERSHDEGWLYLYASRSACRIAPSATDCTAHCHLIDLVQSRL